MRVLVTGASGFTGGHLVRHLRSRGYSVRAMVRRGPAKAGPHPAVGPYPAAEAGVEAGFSRPEIDYVLADLRDASAVQRAADGVDIVYHIAAIYREAGLKPAEYRAVNADAVRTVIEAARRGGATRVVHCSTVGVHGDVEHPPANEDAPLRPGDVYQETKVEGEQVAQQAARDNKIELVIARPTGIYGPGDRRLLKLFRGVSRRRFVVLGGGRIFYHLTYVDDLVEGFRLCGEVPGAAGRTYILAGGEVTTLNDLVMLIAREAGVDPPGFRLPVWPFWVAGAACEAICAPFGIEPPLYRRRVDFFTKSRAFDISRARAELGYDPKVSLREGIRRTLDWYRANGWL